MILLPVDILQNPCNILSGAAGDGRADLFPGALRPERIITEFTEE